MPTNIYRDLPKPPAQASSQNSNNAGAAGERIEITVGQHTIEASLADTQTAKLFLQALPIFSVAETWGENIHFETPVPTGRDHTATLNASPGDICFWTSDNRVIIAFGPSPISRPDEIRLPQLCNIFATAKDDVTVLKHVTPGEKVTIKRANN